MEFIGNALNYLLGAPILGLGTDVGFIWKALLLLVTLLVFTAYVLLWWARSACYKALPTF
jgi:NADH-quinone oxidoreductase subunit H